MIESVRYISEKIACELTPSPREAMLSISDPGIYTVPLKEGWPKLLRCYFPDAGCDAGLLKFVGGYSQYLTMGFPSHVHALQMRNFIADLASSETSYKLIVHCHAGRSRSAAVAKYTAEIHNLEFDHDYEKFNQTVYRLMHDPYCYAPPGYEQTKRRPIGKIRRLMATIGLSWIR